MSNFHFRLVLAGVHEITPELSDVLYEATGGDIEFNMRDGVAWLEFERTADSLRDAIVKAIEQVDQSGVGVRVIRVESDEANTITKINADLFGVASV
jgi:hypothetical protein